MTLEQWLAVDMQRRMVVRVVAGEVHVNLVGENMTWRGRHEKHDVAIGNALKARTKVMEKL